MSTYPEAVGHLTGLLFCNLLPGNSCATRDCNRPLLEVYEMVPILPTQFPFTVPLIGTCSDKQGEIWRQLKGTGFER